MSYYERVAREYGEMGNSNVGSILAQAGEKGQEALTSAQEASQAVKSGEYQKLGTMVGEKLAGKFVMGRAVAGINKFIINPRRTALDNQAASKLQESDRLGDEVGQIYSKGADRLAQGTNADGSLTADPGMGIRGNLDQGIKFREGDTLPEDVVRDPDGFTAGVNKLSTKTAEDFNNLTDEGKQNAIDSVSRNPGYRATSEIQNDLNSGAIDQETANTQGLQSKLIEQDAIGDAEEATGRSVTQGAVASPYAGTTNVVEREPREVTGQMGDKPEEMFDRETGLSADETATAGAKTGLAEGAGEEAAELGATTLLEGAVATIPVIGEIAGIGYGLGHGIKLAIDAHRQQEADDKDETADSQVIATSAKYAGFNRPNFGSMAMPSFDTSKSQQLLQQ